MEKYSFMDMLFICDVAPGPKRLDFQIHPLTRDLSGLGSVELQNGHVFTTCW